MYIGLLKFQNVNESVHACATKHFPIMLNAFVNYAGSNTANPKACITLIKQSHKVMVIWVLRNQELWENALYKAHVH